MDVAKTVGTNGPSQIVAAMKRLNYEQLSSLPLFFGMDGATLVSICEDINPVIAPMRKGSVILSDGESCRSLVFLLEGELEASSVFGNSKFFLSETIRAITLVEPQCMFGLHTTYTRSYIASGSGYYLRLPKTVVVHRMMENEVFRFNFVNLLSSQVQETTRRLRRVSGSSVEKRMAEFFARQMVRLSGHKTIRCKMTDLAESLCETRLTISHTLRNLESRSLLKSTRGAIEIPAFEKFLAGVE